MIVIPSSFQANLAVGSKFKDLVEFFNQLEQDLQYPNCEGQEDAKRIIAAAQKELIMRGVL